MRLQDSLVFPDMQELCKPSGVTCDADKLMKDYSIKITENDLKEKEPSFPAITYIAGFCARAALKKIPCEAYALNHVTEEKKRQLDRNVLFENLTRGDLKFPVLHTQLVLEKLTLKKKMSHAFMLKATKERYF